MTKLAKLLNSERADLLDGFVCRICLHSLTNYTGKDALSDLNNELSKFGIVLILNENDANNDFSKVGLVSASTESNGIISVIITETFLNVSNAYIALTHALRLQSLIVHELVHRNQELNFKMNGFTDSHPTKYLEDIYELEAMAAEIAHDMQAKSILGGNTLFDISPRFSLLMKDAGRLSSESISKLQLYISQYA